MYSNVRRLLILAATLLLAAAVTGCAESSRPVATGKGNIRGINAIVTSPGVNFLIEERTLATVDFKESSAFSSFDDLTFNFNFDLFLPTEPEATRLATEFIDVLADHEYTVVLTGSIASPTSMFWEDPVREWSNSDTVFEVFFAHLAPSLGEFDVYFAAPGTVPVSGQAVGSLANGERLPVLEFEQGTYELILTPKDDPATIVYQSLPLGTNAQTRETIAIFDPDSTLPGNAGVSVIPQSGNSFPLPDANFPPLVRSLHAAFGIENFDGFFDGDFSNLVYADIGFKQVSPYAEAVTATGLLTLTLTPVGNSGATIHEGDIGVGAASKRTVLLAGEPGAPVFLAITDNGRPLETFPVVRFVNVSSNTDPLDIYVLDPGTPIDDAAMPTIFSFASLADTGFVAFTDGMREVTVTPAGEKTPIATPLILDLANGDVVDIAIVDTVDPALVEPVVYDTQSLP